jgi:hypothetical protein
VIYYDTYGMLIRYVLVIRHVVHLYMYYAVSINWYQLNAIYLNSYKFGLKQKFGVSIYLSRTKNVSWCVLGLNLLLSPVDLIE